jgi:hypothetical protein
MIIARNIFGLLLAIGLVLLISFGCSDDDQVVVDAGAADAVVEAAALDTVPWWDEGVAEDAGEVEEDAEAPADLDEHTDLDMAND